MVDVDCSIQESGEREVRDNVHDRTRTFDSFYKDYNYADPIFPSQSSYPQILSARSFKRLYSQLEPWSIW